MVALQWVLGEPVTKDMFVLNRLNEIITRINDAKKYYKVICNHIDTAMNPADMASRGTFDEEFQDKFEFWITGPHFSRTPSNGPEQKYRCHLRELRWWMEPPPTAYKFTPTAYCAWLHLNRL